MLMKLARAFSSLPNKNNPKSDIIRLSKKDPARTLSGSSGSLLSRILEASNPKVSIFIVLDQWVNEGRSVERQQLRHIIKHLTKLSHFHHALQISQWMGSKSHIHLSSTDFTLQLDLISKVHGVQQAEEYFNNIPNTSKDFRTYETLLNSYADAKLVEKAEDVMQIIRNLSGYKTISYNVMLKLYSYLGKHAKLDSLLQEMEGNGIEMNRYTYSTILNAYANASDIGRMQKLLMKMETDFLVTMDWSAYLIAAKGFLQAGDMGKAVASLKTSEQLIPVATRAFPFLMTMYANMGKKDEVYRIWNIYKKKYIICNTSYLCMMSSLVKLDNLDGAQKVFDEWETKNVSFDFRLPNFLISAYCRKGLLAKAESILQRLSEDGKEPNASTWARMAFGYTNEKQMEKAVEALQKSLLASGHGSEPNFSVLDSCLKYLNKKGDLERIEHVKRLLEKQGTKCAYANQRSVKMCEEEINPGLRAISPIESDELALEEEMLEATGTKGGDYNNKSAPTRVSEIDSARTQATIPAKKEMILLSRLLQTSKRKPKSATILDQWVKEGRSIGIEELREIIKKFRKLRHNKNALQISQWMSGKSLDLSSADVAVQLDLVSKVYGVEKAEDFFNKIPNSSKNFQIYGVLLKCYADAKLLEKAEVVMETVRNLGYAETLSYNIMLKLYSHFGMYDKLVFLVQEMEEYGIELDVFTYNVLLDAYVGALDIDRMEKLLMKMESDFLVTMDWNAYVVAAKGYLRAGNMVKALVSLKKSEQLVTFTSQNFAYDTLMIMYALMGKTDEADRICNLYKSEQKIPSKSYLRVMKSLAKLDDIDNAQKVFDEWEAKTSSFNSHLPNFLISAYCKKGLLGKAEAILQKFLQHETVPSAHTWTTMAYGYQKEKQMEKAVEALKKSILASKRGDKPSFTILDSCLKHLIDMGDFDGIEHIKRFVAERGIDYTDAFERLKESDGETCHSTASNCE